MEILRNDDGSLVVPVETRGRDTEDTDDGAPVDTGPTTRVIHPGEGGYDEALADVGRPTEPRP